MFILATTRPEEEVVKQIALDLPRTRWLIGDNSGLSIYSVIICCVLRYESDFVVQAQLVQEYVFYQMNDMKVFLFMSFCAYYGDVCSLNVLDPI